MKLGVKTLFVSSYCFKDSDNNDEVSQREQITYSTVHTDTGDVLPHPLLRIRPCVNVGSRIPVKKILICAAVS